MTTTGKKACVICNTDTEGEYCHNCGLKNTGKRLKLVSFINDTFFSLFDLERSGLATILLLVKSPAKVIHLYWKGYRKYYQPPGKLMAFAVLVIGIHIIVHDNLIFGLMFTDSPQWVFFLIFLVVFTGSSYLTYLRQPGNFLEHSVANIYLFCTWTTILIILYEVTAYFSPENHVISLLALLSLISLMVIWTARTFCRNKSWIIIALSAFVQLLVLTVIIVLLVWMVSTFTGLPVNY